MYQTGIFQSFQKPFQLVFIILEGNGMYDDIVHIYTDRLTPCKPVRNRSISRWKVAGAFFKPNGIRINSWWPNGVNAEVNKVYR